MATLYTQQDTNVRKTWFLMTVFLCVIVALGYFMGYYYNNPSIIYIALVFALGMNVFSYWYSDKIALSLARAHPADRGEYPELFRSVENLSITAGLPMPRVFIIVDAAPNAFATGRNKEHAAVAVTSGLLAMLDKNELEGVIAHELAHIGNKDILLQTIVVVLVGFVAILADIFIRSSLLGGGRERKSGEGNAGGVLAIVGIIFVILSPIIAQLIQLAISRKREFLADASGALLTRYPEGLASALTKIGSYSSPMAHAHNATAHLFISNPFGGKSAKGLSKLFMTHPPTEERVAALRSSYRTFMLKSFMYFIIVTGVAVLLVFLVYGLSINGHIYSLRSSYSFINTIFPETPFRTVFVGDIMLDRAVAQHAKKLGKEHIFSGVEYVFRTADAVIGNLEGTISSRQSIALPGSSVLRFTFDPSYATLLKQVGFTAVSLANNHSLDFGHAADTETREHVHAADILTFGSALNSRALSTIIPIKGNSFCMVGYHDLFVPDPSGVLVEIQNIRPNCSKVTVFVHWGSEYTHVPSDRQRSLSHAFIDAGADLVIGAHPHVVQPVEIYNGKAIFYSLGNFVFDQNFSFATMHGLMVVIDWGPDRTRFELIPVSIRNGQVTIAGSEERGKVLETLIDSSVTHDVATSIRAMGEFVVEKED